MKLLRTWAIVLRQFYLLRDNLTRLFQIFVWIMVDVTLWGFLSHYLNSVAAATFSFVPVLLGAVLLWDFSVRVLHGVTTAFLEDVWSRNLLNIFATPMTVPEYILGMIFSSIATSGLGLIAMLLLASLFGFSFFVYGLMVVPFLLILFAFGISLGIIGMAILLRFGPSSEWLIWPIGAVLSPFVGVFYPVSTLPLWMQYISKILPPSYVFEGVRAVVAHQSYPVSELLLGATLAIGYIGLAYLFFQRIYKRVVRTGLITRFSAESA